MSVILYLHWPQNSTLGVENKSKFLASLSASILAALGLSLLLLHEERRSDRASVLATLYLFTIALCDVVYLFLTSQKTSHTDFWHVVFIRCCMHTALLLLEWCTDRLPPLCTPNKVHSPDEFYSVVNRALFIWINPFLVHGYKNILIQEDMPPLSQDMRPEVTRCAILKTWSQRG